MHYIFSEINPSMTHLKMAPLNAHSPVYLPSEFACVCLRTRSINFNQYLFNCKEKLRNRTAFINFTKRSE